MHLNLTGIIEVALDFFHNIACNDGHLVIRDDIRLEHDADFTARLNRKTLIHAVKRVGDLLKLLKAGRAADMASAACTRQATIVLGSTSL